MFEIDDTTDSGGGALKHDNGAEKAASPTSSAEMPTQAAPPSGEPQPTKPPVDGISGSLPANNPASPPVSVGADNMSAVSEADPALKQDVANNNADEDAKSAGASKSQGAGSSIDTPKPAGNKAKFSAVVKQGVSVASGVLGGKKLEDADWLYDRYQAASVQRNLMIIINILAIISIAVSTVTSTEMVKRKSLDPFVIEIDKKTGIVTLVEQDKVKLFTPDQAVNNFFLVHYMRNRETFDPRNFKYNYYKVVRVMSSEDVFRGFLRFLRADNSQNPMTAFANNQSCNLTIRSIHYLQPDTVQVRFSVTAEFTQGNNVVKNKIVIINFSYSPVALPEEDRYLNPLGFTVLSYNVSDEVV